ncbi:hypothetical protein [Janthinobacterium sp.]|uniref:hypothetical protein n=1 Tax=Janthinobacterium sp. TaxID=1871054 RepID=UPI002584D798|nr:hypothetical protein [Janthinobacterium sp.]MCX7295178.1 hypothetical protein [Janthinobacterium sp.]
MNWDIVKGVLILLVAVSVLGTAFVLISASGPDKAACIARALKSGTPVGNIERVCRLLDK